MNQRVELDFYSLSESDQQWYLCETWCVVCKKADLGISDPELYVEGGSKYIEGKCLVCGSQCVSTVTEHRHGG